MGGALRAGPVDQPRQGDLPATGTTKGEVISYYVGVADRWCRTSSGGRSRANGGRTASTSSRSSTRTGLLGAGLGARGSITHSRAQDVPDRRHLDGSSGRAAAASSCTCRSGGSMPRRAGEPRRLVFDLDPGPGVGLAECARSRAVRDHIARHGARALPGDERQQGHPPLRGAGRAEQLARRVRGRARVAQRSRRSHAGAGIANDEDAARRQGAHRLEPEHAAKTTIAPYSLRGRTQPTVAAPRTWEELDDPDLRQLRFDEVLDRVERRRGPARRPRRSRREADKLATYRRCATRARRPNRCRADAPGDGNDDTLRDPGAPRAALH